MKIHLDLPWGGTFDCEREPRKPLSEDKFMIVCLIIGGAIFAAFLILS